jgi:hypothetical protein
MIGSLPVGRSVISNGEKQGRHYRQISGFAVVVVVTEH